MQLKLSELRRQAALAQFSPREISPHVLRFIEENGDMVGETIVSVDTDGVRVISDGKISGNATSA